MKKVITAILFVVFLGILAFYQAVYPSPKQGLYYLINFLAVSAFILVYLSFGRKLFSLFNIPADTAFKYPASFALSTGFCGTIVFIGGVLGGYTVYFAYALISAMALASLREMKEIFSEAGETALRLSERKYSLKEVSVISAAAGALVYVFICAMAPATYFDSLSYHLGVPSQYIARGGVFDMPGNIFSYFPQIINMNYLLLMLFSSELAVKVFQFFTAAMAIACACMLAKKIRGSAAVAGMLVLTSPLFVLAATRAGVEAPMAFLTLLLLLFFTAKQGNKMEMGDNLFAGALIGIIISSKYTGAVIYIFGAAYLLWLLIKKQETAASLAAAVLTPLVMILPYLLRNYIYTGDPVYPFLTGFFKVAPAAAADAAGYVSHVAGFGPGRTILNFLISPWQTAFSRNAFGGDIVSPAMLITIFALIFTRAKGALLIAAFFCFYYTVWFFSGAVLRFLLPAEAALMAAAALCYSSVKSPLKTYAAALLVVSQLLITVYFVEKHLQPFMQFTQTRQEYLSSKVDYYRAAEFLNKYDSAGRKALMLGDSRDYYFKMEVLAYTVFNHREILETLRAGGGEGFAQELKARKISFVIINRAQLESLKTAGYADVFDAVNSAKFKNIMDKYFKKLYIDNSCEIYEMKGI